MANKWNPENGSRCLLCKHLHRSKGSLPKGTCNAFPDKIPFVIVSSQVGHLEPLDGQENDIVFEPIDDWEKYS